MTDASAIWSIVVDLSPLDQLERELSAPRVELITQAIGDAAELVRQTWQRAVSGERLPGMAKPVNDDQYLAALATGQALQMIGPLHGAVVCLYDGAARVEEGVPAFDMKPGLLHGPSARQGTHGRYNVIPFRHMTPQKGEIGEGSRPHGSTMPANVYKIVKNSGEFRDPGNARLGEQQGQRSKLAQAINIEALARNLPAPMASNYTWKFGMYHGMRRIVKEYGKTTQSTYMTWRAVSERSDPSSWINPGQPANPVIAAVIEASRADVEAIIMAGARAAYGIE